MAVDKRGKILKEHCIFGIHVHKAARIVGWLHLVFLIAVLLYAIVLLIIFITSPSTGPKTNDGMVKVHRTKNSYKDTLVRQISAIITVTILISFTALFLYGIKKQKALCYAPFIFVVAMMSAICIYLIVIVPYNNIESITKSSKTVSILKILLVILTSIVAVVCFVAYIYFSFIVVNRSRVLMYAEQRSVGAKNWPKTKTYA